MIERGHALGDIRGYTLMQLRTFSLAAVKARRRELAENLVSLRAARYEKSEYADFLRKLTDG